jgi:uncharacterized protein (TIGR00725 family)
VPQSPPTDQRSVAVLGSSLPTPGEETYELAREVGRLLSRHGLRLVCGGYGGVMEAACRGAAGAGGKPVGVVLEGRGQPNRWVAERVAARDLSERLRILRDRPDAWIFLPRGLGTMLELCWIAESIVKGDARARPLVFVGEYWRSSVERAVAEASAPEGAASLRASIRFAASPAGAVEAAVAGFR